MRVLFLDWVIIVGTKCEFLADDLPMWPVIGPLEY